jgi:hypothetical protein
MVALARNLWSVDWWHEQCARHHILVMTPQLLLNLLVHSMLRLQEVALLVLDECHHAVGSKRADHSHPYAQIMKHVKFFLNTQNYNAAATAINTLSSASASSSASATKPTAPLPAPAPAHVAAAALKILGMSASPLNNAQLVTHDNTSAVIRGKLTEAVLQLEETYVCIY